MRANSLLIVIVAIASSVTGIAGSTIPNGKEGGSKVIGRDPSHTLEAAGWPTVSLQPPGAAGCGFWKTPYGEQTFLGANGQCYNIQNYAHNKATVVSNKHCDSCVFWEHDDCKGKITWVGGKAEELQTISPSLSYRCVEHGVVHTN